MNLKMWKVPYNENFNVYTQEKFKKEKICYKTRRWK